MANAGPAVFSFAQRLSMMMANVGNGPCCSAAGSDMVFKGTELMAGSELLPPPGMGIWG